ncbi:MAG TPA: post-transcriptional regulator [Bacilli bacterium]
MTDLEQVAYEALTEDEMNKWIEELCHSKSEEFRMIGYEHVTGREIWACVSEKYKEIPPLHRVVNDILSLKVTKLMNWMTMNAYKGVQF